MKIIFVGNWFNGSVSVFFVVHFVQPLEKIQNTHNLKRKPGRKGTIGNR